MKKSLYVALDGKASEMFKRLHKVDTKQCVGQDSARCALIADKFPKWPLECHVEDMYKV